MLTKKTALFHKCLFKSSIVIEGATTMVYLIKTGNSTWKDAYQKLKEAADPQISMEISILKRTFNPAAYKNSVRNSIYIVK